MFTPPTVSRGYSFPPAFKHGSSVGAKVDYTSIQHTAAQEAGFDSDDDEVSHVKPVDISKTFGYVAHPFSFDGSNKLPEGVEYFEALRGAVRGVKSRAFRKLIDPDFEGPFYSGHLETL